jgi:uncharacterized protein
VERTEQARDVHLTLCLTHDCNLRCRYCYGGHKTERHMRLSTARAALDRALARCGQRLHLVFFGGEPLLRWRELTAFTQRAEQQAAQRGVRVLPTVTTNGTLLTASRAAWLQQHQFVTAVSCDGVQAAHDANRIDARGGGSHGATLAGIRRALAAGLRVRVILVLDPANVALLPESVAWLLSLGVRDLVVNPNWHADWSGPSLSQWEQAYDSVGHLYVEAWRAGHALWLSCIDTKIQTHIKGGLLPSERCDLGRKDLVVAPGGNLYPCDRMVGEDTGERFVLGHVTTGVDPQRLQRVLGGACQLPPDCLGCAIAKRCRNRCACANLAMSGSVTWPTELLCFHEQLSVRVADEAAETLVAERNEGFVRRHYPSGV